MLSRRAIKLREMRIWRENLSRVNCALRFASTVEPRTGGGSRMERTRQRDDEVVGINCRGRREQPNLCLTQAAVVVVDSKKKKGVKIIQNKQTKALRVYVHTYGIMYNNYANNLFKVVSRPTDELLVRRQLRFRFTSPLQARTRTATPSSRMLELELAIRSRQYSDNLRLRARVLILAQSELKYAPGSRRGIHYIIRCLKTRA